MVSDALHARHTHMLYDIIRTIERSSDLLRNGASCADRRSPAAAGSRESDACAPVPFLLAARSEEASGCKHFSSGVGFLLRHLINFSNYVRLCLNIFRNYYLLLLLPAIYFVCLSITWNTLWMLRCLGPRVALFQYATLFTLNLALRHIMSSRVLALDFFIEYKIRHHECQLRPLLMFVSPCPSFPAGKYSCLRYQEINLYSCTDFFFIYYAISLPPSQRSLKKPNCVPGILEWK